MVSKEFSTEFWALTLESSIMVSVVVHENAQPSMAYHALRTQFLHLSLIALSTGTPGNKAMQA